MHLLLAGSYVALCLCSVMRLQRARNVFRRSFYAVLIIGWLGKAVLSLHSSLDTALQLFLFADVLIFTSLLLFVSVNPLWWLRWLMVFTHGQFVLTIYTLLIYFNKPKPHYVITVYVLSNVASAVLISAPRWSRHIPALRQKPLRRSNRHIRRKTNDQA
jgi:hypothetical protein